MKKIKDMAQDELERLVSKVVYRITDPLSDVMKSIVERFEKIEMSLQQEIEYPNTYKAHILKDISDLTKEIDDLLEKIKEIKRKEKK